MSLIPRWYNRFPSILSKQKDSLGLGSWFEELEEGLGSLANKTGLTVSSDDKNIYVEADVPGLSGKDVEVTIDNEGILWIKGKRHEEKKGKNIYRQSQQSFSYCIPLGGEFDDKGEIQATCENGVMCITLPKKKEKQVEAKKIEVKDKK